MGTTLMTGASRGLGREAAEHLLRSHPDRHLLVFNRKPGLAAELTAATGNRNVSEVVCDLASFAEIRRAAAEVDGPLDGFLGNAGLQMTGTRKLTADGFEMTFGVNVLAYHLLLNLLRPRFTNPARIIVVGSDVHDADLNTMGLIPPPRWDDPRELVKPGKGSGREGRRAYATSKLGVVYLVHALRRRLPEGVDVYSYNPGRPAGRLHSGRGRSAAGGDDGGAPSRRERFVHQPRRGDPVIARVLRRAARGRTVGRRRRAVRTHERAAPFSLNPPGAAHDDRVSLPGCRTCHRKGKNARTTIGVVGAAFVSRVGAAVSRCRRGSTLERRWAERPI
jgi:NAD(P)-dependent dehydrogenase (short-subunit alcohol dehydrogenase family)